MAPRIVDIRNFNAREFRHLLQAESQTWLQVLHWNYAPSAEIISSYLNAKRLSGFAALIDNCITGYALYFHEGSKGTIGNLFVLATDSCNDAAARLIEQTLATLISMPEVRRIEAQLPHSNIEQISPYFHARSFQIYRRQFMTSHFQSALEGFNPATGPTASSAGRPSASCDFQFRPWERKYDHEAVQLLYHAYQGHIDAAINDQYCTFGGSKRLLESIVRQRGCGDYLSEASTVAIHRRTGRLAGMLALTQVRPGTAHIPQISVAVPYQGMGLGTALLRNSFSQLNRMGFGEISLTVTTLNSRAVRLYERLGFQTLQEFGAFVWDRPE